MADIEWGGLLLAAALGVLAFAVTRAVVRRWVRRQAAQSVASANSHESRQVRRARERKRTER